VNIVFAYDGTVGFSGIWTGMTAARSFDKALIDISQNATHWIRYTGGATAALLINEQLTGNTSAKTCRLLARAIENGNSAGSSDAGILLVNSVSGAFLGDTTLTGGTSTGTATINSAQEFIPLLALHQPKAALITVENAPINFTFGGIVPTVTSGTNFVHYMAAGQSYVIRGAVNIRTFACINAVASNGAILKYSLFF
jgi:hypothetical protein